MTILEPPHGIESGVRPITTPYGWRVPVWRFWKRVPTDPRRSPMPDGPGLYRVSNGFRTIFIGAARDLAFTLAHLMRAPRVLAASRRHGPFVWWYRSVSEHSLRVALRRARARWHPLFKDYMIWHTAKKGANQ